MNEKSNESKQTQNLAKKEAPNDLSFYEMNFYYNGCDFNSINNLLTTKKCYFNFIFSSSMRKIHNEKRKARDINHSTYLYNNDLI